MLLSPSPSPLFSPEGVQRRNSIAREGHKESLLIAGDHTMKVNTEGVRVRGLESGLGLGATT